MEVFSGLQSFARYLGLALAFVWDGARALNAEFNFCFAGVFSSVGGGMGTGLSFYGVWTLSSYFLFFLRSKLKLFGNA